MEEIMKNRKNRNNKAVKKLSFTIIGIVVGLSLIGLSLLNVTFHREWGAMADYNPGSGAGGFLRIGTCVHSATPGTTYATNVSSWYEYTDSAGSAEMTGETPSDTAFDYVMKFRTNVSQNYASNNATWVLAWVRGQIDIDFDYATDVTGSAGNMVCVEVAHNTNYAWYQAYIQDSDGGAGSGFTIANDEDFTINWYSADTYS